MLLKLKLQWVVCDIFSVGFSWNDAIWVVDYPLWDRNLSGHSFWRRCRCWSCCAPPAAHTPVQYARLAGGCACLLHTGGCAQKPRMPPRVLHYRSRSAPPQRATCYQHMKVWQRKTVGCRAKILDRLPLSLDRSIQASVSMGSPPLLWSRHFFLFHWGEIYFLWREILL